MFYNDFKGEKLSALGFGSMRLPLIEGSKDAVDEAEVSKMVSYAFEHGINYYDTAYSYHNNLSEIILGKALKQLPREKFFLATKFPGHQIIHGSTESYEVKATFEEQLKKCGVDYFDFYLLHNIYEGSVAAYYDKERGIVDYLLEQKKIGRIRHLGFSTHALVDTLTKFLDVYGSEMEFGQIQMNYLDWTLQDAKTKYDILTERGIDTWVMEPVRGGKLATLEKEQSEKLRAFRPDESDAAWAFRFIMDIPNVKMILSGMSNMAQLKDNIKTFSEKKPLSETERNALLEIAENMKNSVPCTACRYCCADCPQHLDIPRLLSLYNEVRFAPSGNVGMTIDGIAESERPQSCIACGRCAEICPQKIDIPKAMKDFSEALKSIPHWSDIVQAREKAARKLREKE